MYFAAPTYICFPFCIFASESRCRAYYRGMIACLAKLHCCFCCWWGSHKLLSFKKNYLIITLELQNMSSEWVERNDRVLMPFIVWIVAHQVCSAIHSFYNPLWDHSSRQSRAFCAKERKYSSSYSSNHFLPRSPVLLQTIKKTERVSKR